MDNQILFTEMQRFNQWWLWLILLSFDGMSLFVVFIISRQGLMDKALRYIIIASLVLLILLPTMLFVNLRLETQIRSDGVYARFFPFQLSFKQYTWNSISKAYVRTYNPLGEYGGWGFRFGPSGKALMYQETKVYNLNLPTTRSY